MGSGFSKMKKQAKMMQSQFDQMQEELKKHEEVGSSGGGLVKIWLNGLKEMKKIEIQKECVDPNDLEGLQDLIVAAYKEAFEKVEAKSNDSSPFGGLL
jgi:nucleoid-associated protein EbfC